MKCPFLESHICIRTTGEYRLCCISGEESNTENITNTKPKDWLNSPTVQKAKENLSKGIFPDACRKCMYEEYSGKESKRTKATIGPGITHLDLRFGNSCNLKCNMCGPHSSSSLYYEHQEIISKQMQSPFTCGSKISNWYDDNVLDFVDDLEDLQEVYITGGEPMLEKNLVKFLERLDRQVAIRFSTNGTVANPKALQALERFNNVSFCLSIDGIGKVNDYIRWGSRWGDIVNNIPKFKDLGYISLGPTIQIQNILYYDDLLEYADKNNFEVYENILVNPKYMNINSAPYTMKEKIKHFKNFITFKSDHDHLRQFIEHITVLDKNRSTHIKFFLPEVAKYYGID